MTSSSYKRRVPVVTEGDVTASVLAASRVASDLGFSPSVCQTISTAVSELARNILKYAGKGEILIESITRERVTGIQITVRDQGPGIEDLEAAMSDHYSSGGTLGLGLPGVKRLMDEFDIRSSIGSGTQVVIRKWRDSTSRVFSSPIGVLAPRRMPSPTTGGDQPGDDRSGGLEAEGLECGYFIRPCRGERVSGDIVIVDCRSGVIFLAIVDALGHGQSAHAIALVAARELRRSWTSDLTRTVERLHEALKGTDGAAAGLCVVNPQSRTANYVGVGNTVVRTLGRKERGIYSTPGTLGAQIRTPREQTLAIGPGDILVLFTDGVKERFELEDYPQLRYEGAKTIARTIVTRYGKDYDDAGCVALRVPN
jgi:anti-sigma regulatory factor (Ser/Thr protein kinase)